jgi:hypothetical protein
VPNSEHVYKQDQDCGLYLARFLPNGRHSFPEARLDDGKPRDFALRKEAEFLRGLALLSAAQAIHEGNEKRREHRFVVKDPAVLQILNPFSGEYSEVAIVDVSKHELRLHVPAEVMPDSLVKVRIKNDIAFGRARYYVPATEGFFVGVHLHDYISHRVENITRAGREIE